jgi:RNA polymerase sigma-70 factor (ECF subfamily)
VSEAASRALAVSKLLDQVMRAHQARLIAVLAASLRDIALAEDVLQEAALSALTHWGRTGPPHSPDAWLLAVARRKAIDRLRRNVRSVRHADTIAQLVADADAEYGMEAPLYPDKRLSLIFVCCHPALEMKSRVALTLRTVCGLTTTEIARVFLDAEPTMGQRISRAKAKIAAAGIPFAVPEATDWPARRDAVLATVYLIFTTGYVAGPGEPRDLCAEAEYLMRLIDRLHPHDPETEGALAMMLLAGARRAARVGVDGASVPPVEQDRSLWDWNRIHEGRAVLSRAMERRQPGPFQLKAAIADCQMLEHGADWPQIAALYGALLQHEPTPVVRLNAAVALAESGNPTRALAMVNELQAELGGFQPWHAARAALCAMVGDRDGARRAYETAIADAPSQADALLLSKRRDALG